MHHRYRCSSFENELYRMLESQSQSSGDIGCLLSDLVSFSLPFSVWCQVLRFHAFLFFLLSYHPIISLIIGVVCEKAIHSFELFRNQIWQFRCWKAPDFKSLVIKNTVMFAFVGWLLWFYLFFLSLYVLLSSFSQCQSIPFLPFIYCQRDSILLWKFWSPSQLFSPSQSVLLNGPCSSLSFILTYHRVRNIEPEIWLEKIYSPL